jgi:hypothetical protein
MGLVPVNSRGGIWSNFVIISAENCREEESVLLVVFGVVVGKTRFCFPFTHSSYLCHENNSNT